MNVLIIAPHIDDELIGCWSVFQNPENRISIAWIYETTNERLKEGFSLSQSNLILATIGTIYVDQIDDLKDQLKSRNFDEVYIPSRKDSHFDHKRVNCDFRKYATHYYSVDMIEGRYLGEVESTQKWEALNSIYLSQSLLWKYNAKYYLFESISYCDYDSCNRFRYKGYEATIPSLYYDECVRAIIDTKITSCEHLMDIILQKCPTGKVVVEFASKVLCSEG